jgi:hypothetical protein
MDITGEQVVYDGSYHYRPALDWRGEPKRRLNGRLAIQKVTTKRGDNRGAWYHFAGTALAAYTYSLGKFDFGKPRFTYFMIWLEKINFRESAGAANQKRIFIDKAGANFGYHLRQAFRSQSGVLRLRDDYKGFRREVYVDRPDVFKSKYILKPGQRPQQWGTQLTDEHPVYQSLEYLRALLLMHSRKTGVDIKDPLVLNPIRLMSSSEGDRFLALLRKYSQSAPDREMDEFLAELVMKGNEFEYLGLDLIVNFESLQPAQMELVREKWKLALETMLEILRQHDSPDFIEAQSAYNEMRRSNGILDARRDVNVVRQCGRAHAI